MPKPTPMIGIKINHLTAVKIIPARVGNTHYRYVFDCDCGNSIEADGADVRSGKTKSCGCHRAKRMATLNLTHGHSGRRSPEYRSWEGMKQRCTNPDDSSYDRYGGRGIKVSPSWLNSFKTFLADMGPRPSGTTLDRIENNGDYEPGNCKWSTSAEQVRNTRKTFRITHNGETMILEDWARRVGIGSGLIWHRMKRLGMTFGEAIAMPVKPQSKPRKENP